jgi:uncharacterized membrane protein YhaH (DUF805 family)
MTFTESVSYCLSNYFTFGRRGSRSEYWWFVLACFLADAAGSIVDIVIGYQILGTLISLATLIPTIAAAARRLHDTERSGWWQLLGVIPIIGWILLIVWLASRGTEGPNRFGRAPASAGSPSAVRA